MGDRSSAGTVKAGEATTRGIPERVVRRMERARPGWLSALRVTMAGHLNAGASIGSNVGGTRNPIVVGALALLMLFGIGAAEAGFFFLMRTLHIGMVVAGQPMALPIMAVMGAQLLVVVFGVAFAISSLFFSSDVPRLMAMPLQPATVMGVRFATLYLDVLLVTVAATAPAFVAAASVLPPDVGTLMADPGRVAALFDSPVRLTGDPLYWTAAVWLWLWIPVLPLGVATLIAVVVGRGTAVGRRRDLLYVVGSLVGLALAMGYQYLNVRIMPRMSDPAAIVRMLQTPNAVILEAVRYYPPARWAAGALMGQAGQAGPAGTAVVAAAGQRLEWLLWFAAASVIVTAPAFALAQRWYFAGVQAGLEEPPARRQRREGGAREGGHLAATLLGRPARSRMVALAVREWRLLLRTPPFMLPVVTNVLVPPLVVAMMLLFIPSDESGGSVIALLQGVDPRWLAAGLAGLIIFMGSNQVAPTSISREGKGLAQVAALPATPSEQVGARLLVAAPFGLATAFVMAGVAWWVVKMPLETAAVGLAIGIAGLWPSTAGGLWVDLLRPVTNWDSPQQAMKGNINGLWGMVVALATAAVSGGAGYLVWRASGELSWALGTATVGLLALGAVLTWLCMRQATRLFENAGETT